MVHLLVDVVEQLRAHDTVVCAAVGVDGGLAVGVAGVVEGGYAVGVEDFVHAVGGFGLVGVG